MRSLSLVKDLTKRFLKVSSLVKPEFIFYMQGEKADSLLFVEKCPNFGFSKQDADTIFQEAAALNMTGHGYAWIATEQVTDLVTIFVTRDILVTGSVLFPHSPWCSRTQSDKLK